MATSEEIDTDTITVDDVDKNLSGFLKAYSKWANSLHKQTEEERTRNADALQLQLFEHELLKKRSRLVQNRQDKDIEFYDKKHKEMEGKVKEARLRFKLMSVEVKKSEEEKKKKQEYNSMAKKIKTLPSRQTLQGQISAVSKEVDTVQKKKEKLSANLEKKRRIVFLLGNSASSALRSMKAEDESNKKNHKSDKDASMELSTSTPKMESHHEEEEEQEANQKDVSFDTLSDSVFECENIGEEEDDYELEPGEILDTSSEQSQEDDTLDDSFEKT